MWGKKDWKEPEEEEKKVTKKKKAKSTSLLYLFLEGKIEEVEEYIWTYEIGDKSKPKLIVIHGYGGSGMLFFKMFKDFAEHFHVYFIDLLGMGRSSRNDFECNTYQE